MKNAEAKSEEKSIQKQMAEKLLEVSKDNINRNIKDSVFCDLFSQPKYLMQLYQALHPEDTDTSVEDLTIVTLSRIVARNIYNDLGFLAGNRLLVLVEAQSTWSENILIRFLMYLGETYRRYIKTNGLKIYNEKNVEVPRPELYVVYTGERRERPEKISLRQCFFEGEYCCVDVEAKVFYDNRQGDILHQYITFCRVFDAQRQLYPGDKAKAVRETIRICLENNVLKDYLIKEEAAAVMFTVADQVDAMKEALTTERAEGEFLHAIRQILKKNALNQSVEKIAEDLLEKPDFVRKVCGYVKDNRDVTAEEVLKLLKDAEKKTWA